MKLTVSIKRKLVMTKYKRIVINRFEVHYMKMGETKMGTKEDKTSEGMKF